MEAITAQRSLGDVRAIARFALFALRLVMAAALSLAALAAGVGVLYLIRTVSPLGVGPEIHGALPLQQLAGGDSQPLLRMIVAWVPAGIVAGLALGWLTNLGARAGTVVLAGLAAAVLLIAGAAADAIAITDPLGPHLRPQLTRVGTWTAVALFAIGSVLAGRLERGESGG